MAEYWARVDCVSKSEVADLYTEQGSMQLGALVVEGRKNIAEFFKDRNRQQLETSRLTRHLMSNLRLEISADNRVVVHSLLCIFAGSGDLPLVSDTPSTIADFKDVLVKDSSGQWLVETKTSSIVFAGRQAASFVK